MPISEPTAVFSIRDDRDMEIKQAVLQVYRALEESAVAKAAFCFDYTALCMPRYRR